jgi:REP element-mobilizing transposase RayT
LPRSARKRSETGIYHTILRGINQQLIFEEPEDFERFLAIIKAVKELSHFELYAYCLLGNHVHLLIKETDEPLSLIFKRLAGRYASWYNWKYQRHGHLFQDRFISEPVENEAYFITVINYIHLNPLKAGLCAQAARYPWSSLALFTHQDPLIDWVALEKIVPLSDLKHPDEARITPLPFEITEGRVRRYSDSEAQELLEHLCGAKSVTQFQALTQAEQRAVYPQLRNQGVPIRQITRITGTSNGAIVHWTKK